jgi:hypothetical protein
MIPQVTDATAAEQLRTVEGSRPADQYDERWRQWMARGAAHDRAVHRRLLRACILGLVVAAIAASAWLSFGGAR